MIGKISQKSFIPREKALTYFGNQIHECHEWDGQRGKESPLD
jgi:hypothetical protein